MLDMIAVIVTVLYIALGVVIKMNVWIRGEWICCR